MVTVVGDGINASVRQFAVVKVGIFFNRYEYEIRLSID